MGVGESGTSKMFVSVLHSKRAYRKGVSFLNAALRLVSFDRF